MQRKNLGKAMRYLVAVCALSSALVMVSCGGGGEEGGPTVTSGETISKVDTGSVAVNNSTVQALVGQQFAVPGSIFDPSLGSNQATLAFTGSGTIPNSEAFNLTPNGGSTSSGNTTFGSCIFTFNGGPLAFPGKLPVTFEPCTIHITAGAVTAGGAAVPGNLTFTLGTFSLTLNVQITILANGALLVNGNSTGIIISSNGSPTSTGTTGAGGQ